MNNNGSIDPVFRAAIDAIDEGNIETLGQLLQQHPGLLADRLVTPGEQGYFKDPYLLWFVADNPIRNEKLPENIAAVTKLIIGKLKDTAPASLQQQLDYTLGLVATGRTPRECGVQIALIDLLIDHGAIPDAGLGAIANGNVEAARHLIRRGGKLTLASAAGLGMTEDVHRLLPAASETEKVLALAVASYSGRPDMISLLLSADVNPNGYPESEGFHKHATALHQAVASGSPEAVKLLVNAGADLTARDKVYSGTALDWARYIQAEESKTEEEKSKLAEIEKYLRSSAQS